MEEGRGVLLVVQRHLMVGLLGARLPGRLISREQSPAGKGRGTESPVREKWLGLGYWMSSEATWLDVELSSRVVKL